MIFTVFHVDPPGSVSLTGYAGLMRAGRAALAKTNPDARYVVLSDKATARKLDNEFDVMAVAPDEGPLMVRFLKAQIEFERQAKNGLTILAGSDCVANRPLEAATPKGCGFATTYNKAGRINNVGYARDHNLTAWFLRRALGVLESWSSEKQAWLGDQEAWEEALGARIGGDVQTAIPDGQAVQLYPCRTHNSFPRKDGRLKSGQESAFILHFKGPRKAHMADYVSRLMRTR